MKYLNVSLTGLRGKRHPALSGLVTTHQVRKSRIHIKMLAGDYLTFEIKSKRSGGSSNCRCCPESQQKIEDLTHILSECIAFEEIRERMLPEFSEVCKTSKSNINFEEITKDNETLCQFILDPTSFNLQRRIHSNDPSLSKLFELSRDYCHTINNTRMKLLQKKKWWNITGITIRLYSQHCKIWMIEMWIMG